jgi:hypothetical protein
MEVARIMNPPDALLFPARCDDTPGQRERKASAGGRKIGVALDRIAGVALKPA